MFFFDDDLASYKSLILLASVLAIASTSLFLVILLRLAQILPTPNSTTVTNTKTPARPKPSQANPTHLFIVLGSGGHTAEMLNILTSLPNLYQQFTHRTYLVSSGDAFSSRKAAEFEKEYCSIPKTSSKNDNVREESEEVGTYTIVTVRRARRVHQSWLSTPLSTLASLWDCISALRGTHNDSAVRSGRLSGHTSLSNVSYPDLILTNGPGTGVCVVVAALILRFFGFSGSSASGAGRSKQHATNAEEFTGQGQMRTIFLESWARVKTLSLSGKILRPLVNRFLVQWPELADDLGEGVEYIGPLVS